MSGAETWDLSRSVFYLNILVFYSFINSRLLSSVHPALGSFLYIFYSSRLLLLSFSVYPGRINRLEFFSCCQTVALSNLFCFGSMECGSRLPSTFQCLLTRSPDSSSSSSLGTRRGLLSGSIVCGGCAGVLGFSG